MTSVRESLLHRLRTGVTLPVTEPVDAPVAPPAAIPAPIPPRAAPVPLTPREGLDVPCEECHAPSGLDCDGLRCACSWREGLGVTAGTTIARVSAPGDEAAAGRPSGPMKPTKRASRPRQMLSFGRRHAEQKEREFANEVGVEVYDSRTGGI